MSKYILYIFIFSFYCNFTYTQTTIKGAIKDVTYNPIVSASIFLKDSIGNIIAYHYSDESGRYELKTEKIGAFALTISSLNFEQQSIIIDIENQNENKTIDFVLIPKITELEEVIITSRRPITVKNDTIVFDADAFKQGNEQTVEDLLKKIPGLNIEDDGTIKVGSQEVEKVMIDGDDFFEKGYKILTKNMPVNPIDKIELLQRFSNIKHLKGIENSQKVALNLTLKEDAKSVWFGNMQGGYGFASKIRYEVRSNLMNFGKKNKYYFITNFNNIGDDATGEINDLILPDRYGEPASIGDDQNANTLLNLDFYTPQLKVNRVNLNNAEMLSLNGIFTLSQHAKLKALGFLNTDEVDFFRNGSQQFSIGNTSFRNIENFKGRKTQLTGFGKVDLTYDLSPTKTFEYTGKLNGSKEKNSSNLLFNDDILNERLNANNQLIDQKIVFTNNFKQNKVFLLSSRYINEETPQNYSVNQIIFSNLFPKNANNTRQFSTNQIQFAGIEAHLLDKKKNGDLLEIKIGNQLRIDDLNTRFELLQADNNITLPNGYQNNLTYKTNDLYLSTKYDFNLNQVSIFTQAEAHQLFNKLENINAKSTQNPFFIMPNIGLRWQINKKNKIFTSYSYNTTNARVIDIYPGFVQIGFRSFSKGLEKFNQLNSSVAGLSYMHGSWTDKFFANTLIFYTKNHDFYSTNSVIAQNLLQTEKIIIKDRENLVFSSNIDRFLTPVKSNLKINVGASKSNFVNIVNNSDLRKIESINTNYGLELRSNFKSFFNFHTGSKWNRVQVKTTIKNSFTNNMSFLDLSFMFSDNFNIDIESERYFFGNLDKNIKQYYFLDLKAQYIVKQNKLTFYLSGNNLLNTEIFRDINITDTIVSQTEYRLMPRYVLFKIEYRF